MRDEYDALRLAYRLGITPEQARIMPRTRQEILRDAYRNNRPVDQAELANAPETEREAAAQVRQAGTRRVFPGERMPLAPRSQGPRMSPARGQPSMSPGGEASAAAVGRGPSFSEEPMFPEDRRQGIQRGFPGEQQSLAQRMQGPRMSPARGQPSMSPGGEPPMAGAGMSPQELSRQYGRAATSQRNFPGEQMPLAAAPSVTSPPARTGQSPSRVVSEEDATIAYRLGIPANELTAADRARYAEQQSRPGILSRLFGRWDPASSARTAEPTPRAQRQTPPSSAEPAPRPRMSDAREQPAMPARQAAAAAVPTRPTAERPSRPRSTTPQEDRPARQPRRRPRPQPREASADDLNAIVQQFLAGERPRGGAADNIGRAMGIEGYKKGGLVKPKAPVKKAMGGMIKAPKKPAVPGRGRGRPATAVKAVSTKPMAKAAKPKMPAFKKGGSVSMKKGKK